jgi:hypothetical protein
LHRSLTAQPQPVKASTLHGPSGLAAKVGAGDTVPADDAGKKLMGTLGPLKKNSRD